MVQFVTGYPSRSSMIGKILGESLGEGLGNLVGHHFANKDLEGILADKELAKLPLSERLSKMETVLSRHGKRGQNLLARRLELEQFAEQEKAQQLQQRTAKAETKTLSKILSGEDVSKEEFESLSPKTQLEVLKIKNKPVPGGVTSQAVPPNVQQAMDRVIKENPSSLSDELALEMDKAGVPRIYSNSLIENRRRADDFLKKSETDRSSKMLDEYYELSKTVPLQQANINRIKDSIQEVGGIDKDFIAEVFSFEPLRSAKGAALKNAGKDLFIKTIQGTGARPNQWIEQQIGSALTEIGKSTAANETIAELSQFQLDLTKKKIEVADKVEEEYRAKLGYVPSKIGKEVEKEVAKYALERERKLAYDLRNIYEKEQGDKKLQTLKQVPNGTPLTPRMAAVLLKKTNGDEQAAMRLAQSMGFDLELPEGIE